MFVRILADGKDPAASPTTEQGYGNNQAIQSNKTATEMRGRLPTLIRRRSRIVRIRAMMTKR